jgi:hypothetical protein
MYVEENRPCQRSVDKDEKDQNSRRRATTDTTDTTDTKQVGTRAKTAKVDDRTHAAVCPWPMLPNVAER